MTTDTSPDLTILDNIRVAAPCSAAWDKMAGDEQSRFCGQCQKHVYNLSEMSAEAAVALIREKEGNLCGRLARRSDGTVITSDCPVGARAVIWRTRRLIATCFSAVVVGLMLVVLPSVFAARSDGSRSVVVREVTQLVDDVLIWLGVRPPMPVMGVICVVPPVPPPGQNPVPTPPEAVDGEEALPAE